MFGERLKNVPVLLRSTPPPPSSLSSLLEDGEREGPDGESDGRDCFAPPLPALGLPPPLWRLHAGPLLPVPVELLSVPLLVPVSVTDAPGPRPSAPPLLPPIQPISSVIVECLRLPEAFPLPPLPPLTWSEASLGTRLSVRTPASAPVAPTAAYKVPGAAEA